MYPLKFNKFFKYGVPYAYLYRSLNEKTKSHTYEVIWYFNSNGAQRDNIADCNYSSSKYLGDVLSLKVSYIQLKDVIIRRINNYTKSLQG